MSNEREEKDAGDGIAEEVPRPMYEMPHPSAYEKPRGKYEMPQPGHDMPHEFGTARPEFGMPHEFGVPHEYGIPHEYDMLLDTDDE